MVLLGSMPMVSDAREYFDLALRLVAGDVREPFYWPPGESLVLRAAFALLGPSVAVARALTIAMSTLTVALTVLIARELAGDRVARTAGWMAALYVPSVLLCGQTYAQHLAALCLAAIAYFAMRAAREPRLAYFATAGLALGAGILTRPSMVSVSPVVVAAWAVAAYREPRARRALRSGAVAAGCVALACILPVCAHDARAGAGWTVSTNNERNLFLGNNPFTPDYKTSHLGQRSLEELEPGARTYLESFYARDDERVAMQHAAVAYMIEHPARTSLRTLNRTTSFWGFDYLASREIQKWRGWRPSARTSLALLALEAASYLAIAALAIVTLFAMGASAHGARWVPEAGGAFSPAWRTWLVALALAYELPYTVAFSGGTYHFPVVPLLVPLAAVAASSPRRSWQLFRHSRGAWLALAAFAIVEAQYGYYAMTMSG